MVAKITVPGSLKRALNYNEQKVKQGVASCHYANYFLKEADRLSFHEKLSRFEHLMALNKRATSGAVHISLNFGVEEKLSPEKLTLIARSYMERIGFGEQPYLVYQHYDAGHPHLHIVTTNIKQDGRRISLHNIGRDVSEKARKAIEIDFDLQRAGVLNKRVAADIKPVNAQRVQYGKAATKQGIVNVLDAVLPHYKYASMPELNAVLGLYNIRADRGKEGSVLYQKRGLLYRVLDAQGTPVGVPVKASSIYNKPTLSYLESRFARNAKLKPSHKGHLKAKLDWLLQKPPASLGDFQQALERERISLVVRQNEAGIVYGLTYVDHSSQCVFNGSELGKPYSANAVVEQLKKDQVVQAEEQSKAHTIKVVDRKESLWLQAPFQQPVGSLWKQLADPVETSLPVPYELRKQRKKRRKSP